MKKMEYILIGMLIWIISSAATVSAENNYEWDNVPYGGGGFVTGLTFHPKEKDLVYARTDVGGLYKWDAENNRWHQLCDMFSLNDANLYGIDGVAIDPNDSNVVYICAGKYRKERAIAYGMYIEGKSQYNACDVLKSTDKGNSWQATGLNVDFNGNGTNRHFGEIIAVDPNNSNNIYVLSRDNKLYCSDNGAETWNECAGFPQIPIQGNENNEKEGYARIVVIDPSSVSEGGSKRLYVGVYNGYGVYMSDDMGQTWTDITGENGPKSPTAMKITSNGEKLYVTADNGVYVYEKEQWRNITPSTNVQYNGIDIDPTDNNIVYAARSYGDDGRLFHGHIYRSEDGGMSWEDLYPAAKKFGTINWWPDRYFFSNVSDIKVNPFNTSELWVSDWYGVWKTPDVSEEPQAAWINDIRGMEEMVGFTAISFPEGGPKLMVGNADNDGAVWEKDIKEYPSYRITGNMDITDTNELDFCEESPNIVVRASGNGSEGRYGYSTDYGKTWNLFGNFPKDSSGKMLLSGRVSVSAGVNKETGYPTIFVMPVKSGGYYSRDMGQTWTASEGEPENLISSRFAWSYNFSSDRVTSDVFYGYANGNFYVSSDGGASFNQTVSGLPVYNRSFVRAAPYMQGTVWVALGFDGLYTSSDYGTTMNRLSDVTRAYMIAFGKPADGRTNPTAFLYGEVNNETGIFMSVDMGGSWIRINDDNHMVGDEPTCIGADRQEFGVVYVGTNGRGFTYGRPVKAVNISGGEIKADIPAAEKNDDTVKVFLNGKHILFDTQPEFINDRVSVPIRKIAEAMGAEIEWYPTGNSAMVQLKDKAIYIPNNEFWMLVNNEQYYLDIATYMKDNRLFIPLRSFAEIFGCEVSWDGDNRCVWIATGKEGQQ